jgi:succinoglycan biosynthesis transport protein ExoP
MVDPLEKLTAAAPKSRAMDPGTLVRIIRKRKWMILAIAVAIPAVVGAVVSKQRKIYQAGASLVIDIATPQYLGERFKDVVEMEPTWWTSRENMETEFRVLRSESQALAVAKGLCERKAADGRPALRLVLPNVDCNKADEMLGAARLIQETVRIEPLRDSRIVNIVAQSPSPEFAALAANAHAQAYIERNLDRRLNQSQVAATWLNDEYGDLVSRLHSAEQVLIEFKRNNKIVAVNLESDQNDLSAQRKKISTELTETEVKLINVRAQREMFSSVKWSDPVLDFNPAMAQSEAARRLKDLYMEQYAKLLELRSKYLDKHPLVMAGETRLAAIKSDLVRELEISQKNIELQYQTLNRQAADLRAALDRTTQQALALEERSSEYNRLKRDFDRYVKLTDQVGGREQETSLATHLKTNNVRVLDAARAPTVPISPDVPRAASIAAAIGLLIAFGFAILLETLDNTVKTQEDLEQTVGVPFLGLIPTIDSEKKGQAEVATNGNGNGAATNGQVPESKDLYVWKNPKSSVAECCRSIRTNLLFMSPDKPARTMLITSAGPQEGKTTVAVNLAISLAQSGLSVLLVDTDLRRPRLHKALGIAATGEGLSKAVVGEREVFSVVRDTGIPNLSVLPCGACPPNPAELLHSDRFRRIVDELAGRYDRVIFDSPPLGAVTDPAILSRLTDGTIFVAKAGRTTRDALARARAQLLGSDGRVNILGCIINDLDVNRGGRYGYYYYYYSHYGTYYSEENATPARGGSA